MNITVLERKVAFANLIASAIVSMINFQLLYWLYEKKNWAFLGQGNVVLTFILFTLTSILLNDRYYSSSLAFLAGLEHYTKVFKRILLIVTLLGFSIFFLGLPAGRNYLIVTFVFLTIFWFTYRKLVSILVRSKLRNLNVLLVSDDIVIGKFFSSYFKNLTLIRISEFFENDCIHFDLILFNNYKKIDDMYDLTIARLESLKVTIGYITNEIRFQGWSGLQILIGPHMVLVKMGYRSAFLMKLFKRIFDLIAILPFLLILILVFPLIRIVYVVFNGTPFLYKQIRVGASGKEFVFLKIRTVKKTETFNRTQSFRDSDICWTEKPNLEELVVGGRFLRRWSLDEVPQLMNILKGDMSLVGPRPRLPKEVDDNYKLISPLLTQKIKPGLTGIWQISGRNEISPSFALMLDKYYVDHWSPLVDLQIIFKTIHSVVLGVGAK